VTLVRFVGALSAADSVEQLQRTFLAGFGRVLDVEVYGLTGIGAVGVCDAFLARQEDEPLLAQARATRRTACGSPAERMHRVRHLVHVPIPGADTLFFAGRRDIALAEAIAGVLGGALARIGDRSRVARERDDALAALDLAATPTVTSNPDVRPNAAARRLLAEVLDADENLHHLLARPPTGGPFARRLEVELVTGETAVLHAVSSESASGLVSVLQLEREQPALAPLAGLTPREAEVARLVVDGLADREIAEQLHISHYTVSQYVKRIYRKLSVDSRVALTRLALRPVSG
jgi:DNA-binding CsgD family transcriptional regulator